MIWYSFLRTSFYMQIRFCKKLFDLNWIEGETKITFHFFLMGKNMETS